MSNLTDLTIAGARAGLGAGEFSARELAQAHIDAMARHKGLNAFITETPEVALAAVVHARQQRRREVVHERVRVEVHHGARAVAATGG